MRAMNTAAAAPPRAPEANGEPGASVGFPVAGSSVYTDTPRSVTYRNCPHATLAIPILAISRTPKPGNTRDHPLPNARRFSDFIQIVPTGPLAPRSTTSFELIQIADN